jgi:glutamyl-tRNA synthetase
MTVVTRFAPSPTGRLHVGNIRTALHNFLFARKHGGAFILRVDDTDRERSTAEFDQAIGDDLDWMGLRPDKIVRQSERFDLYEGEFERLKSAGRVYACYETPEELEVRRKVLLGRGLPPVYERKPADAPVPEERAPHWRFKLDHERLIVWEDLIRGEQRFDPKLLSDPVVRREDGSWLYLLPSVIDDVDLRITHIVRGEDHVSNSAAQIQMFEALGSKPPEFAHEALLVAAEGKLSKRLGSYGAQHLRAEGIEPMAMLSVLARIVELVNARLLHKLDFEAVADRLPAGAAEEDWLLLRPNLERLSDFAGWFEVLHGDIEPPELNHDERLLVKDAGSVAEHLDWTDEPWRALTSDLKQSTGKKGRDLFHPLRLALTGRESGPEMAGLIARMGKERAIHRLEAAAKR